jgi:S1-C subfamily serine protease/predicted esterase
MYRRATQYLLIACVCLAPAAWLVWAQGPGAADDLDSLQQQAIKTAAQHVGPSIVQIETSGGTDIIATGPRGPQIRKGMGPTSGVVVAADGYIITSAFNFANKPQAIFVGVPGHKERYVAKVIATDSTRMLTLLKIDAKDLVVPMATPKAEIQIGQTTLALGRALDNLDKPPSVSQGIVSALNRVWGRAIQTDAKVSPTNYGGPLVDLYGRVIGVLVPASPESEAETAGIEWYDSGIGFAIPLEDVFAVLPRMREGKPLHKGLLGITPKTGDLYGAPPTVGTVAKDSAADKSGIKPGDIIKELDGKPVVNQAQLLHMLGPKYEGDTVSLKLIRKKDGKDEEITLAKVVLGSTAQSVAQAFIGILPMRDDPEPGVQVRHVLANSPADKAGLKEGDRLTKVEQKVGPMVSVMQPLQGREQLSNFLLGTTAGTDTKFEVKRAGGKTETITVKLGEFLDDVPAKLPDPDKGTSFKKATEPRKPVAGLPPPPPPEKRDAKVDTGLINRTSAAGDHTYWIYVPKDYDPNYSYALVVWLHPVGKNKKQDVEDFTDTWEDYCKDNHIIMVGPKAENESGWLASEAEFVRETALAVKQTYQIDPHRIVVHGMGQGGQFAFYLGFHTRDLFRGVATTGAALANAPKEKVANQPLAFFVACGSKDPLAKSVADTKTKLTDQKYSVTHREIANMGHQYLDLKTLEELIRWLDSLDRL